MPTRMQILLATPRCPGKQHPVKGWQDCGRPLIWKHCHEAWACTRHGLVLEPERAASLNQAPA